MNSFEKLIAWAFENFRLNTVFVDVVPPECKAPFSFGAVGINWETTAFEYESPFIYVNKSKVSEDYIIGAYIHELAHILCAGDIESDEAPFLGWEVILATKFLAFDSWLKFMSISSYSIENTKTHQMIDFGEATMKLKIQAINQGIEDSIETGYLKKTNFELLFPGYELRAC